MKLIKFEYKGKSDWGCVRDNLIHIVSGDIYTGPTETGDAVPLEEVKVLPPVSPSKIIGAGLNYFGLAKEHKMEIPEEPILFFKPPSSIIGHMDHIIYPANCNRVHYEGELGVVIGKKVKNVSESDAFECVLGYTVANDVAAMDYLERDKQQTTRVKGFDTFSPFGPVIATGIEAGNLDIETRLNGKRVQSSNTNDLIFKIDQLICAISNVMTLLPGDLIMTGSPAGVGPMKKGDTIEIEIEGIGILKNFVS